MVNEERLIAIETDEIDKTLKPREGRLIFSTGRTEIVDISSEEFLDRQFLLGDKRDLQ